MGGVVENRQLLQPITALTPGQSAVEVIDLLYALIPLEERIRAALSRFLGGVEWRLCIGEGKYEYQYQEKCPPLPCECGLVCSHVADYIISGSHIWL